ncbi:hypothetical protein CI088_03975 [Enterococcus plantarum]|uniref:Uncharacterized protein n=2 Tax=Enterococcus plantarum TaxID=1077675 RepID=A0A2W3Z7H6_9ENTE|nr:hypothetical protein CI088_03975 [Enterococcus plantarum]
MDDLNCQQSVLTNEHSTVSKNTAAKNAMKELLYMVQTIAQNIKSVAAEFDEANATIQDGMIY